MDWRRYLRNPLAAGYGIDLGTANTVVATPRRGVILNEPSVMVTRAEGEHSGEAVTVGKDARELTGRAPIGLTTIRPLRDGVITDLQVAKVFVHAILRKLDRQPWQILPPAAVIGIPWGATALERRALTEAVEEAGFGSVHLIPEPIAGAMGCGLDPMTPRALMVVDVGGGTAEVTAFCYGGMLAARSSQVAGDEMTAALHQYLRQQHKLLVGELSAETLKMRFHTNGAAEPLTVEGRDMSSDRPSSVTLKPEEVETALRPTIDSIIDELKTCVEDLPPQAVADIMREGILLLGGGSLLAGFDKRVEEAFGFKVRRAENPLTCVAEGAARCLVQRDVIKAYGG
jgi:rod shape-determining protein MreB